MIDHTHTHARTLTFNILTQRGPQATTGGSRGKGTTHGYDTWPESSRLHLAGAAVSVILSPPWRHLSETTGPKWDYCLRTGGSEAPPLHPAPTPEFARSVRSPRKGSGTGGVFSSAATAAVLALPGVLKWYFSEAEPGALGLTSPILRHGKRVF